MPISSDSPSTYAKLMLRLWGSRLSMVPLIYTSSSEASRRSFSLSRKKDRRFDSSAISAFARAHASPKPTMPVTFNVPDRIPRSCPPPSICAVSCTRGFRRRTYSAPTPFGPYSLWPVKERMSMPSRSEEHTSELQSPDHLVCRLLLEKKKKEKNHKQLDKSN